MANRDNGSFSEKPGLSGSLGMSELKTGVVLSNDKNCSFNKSIEPFRADAATYQPISNQQPPLKLHHVNMNVPI